MSIVSMLPRELAASILASSISEMGHHKQCLKTTATTIPPINKY